MSTKRHFWQRIYDHVSAIKGGDIMSPIGRHGTWKHNKNPHSVRFFALERVHTDIRSPHCHSLHLEVLGTVKEKKKNQLSCKKVVLMKKCIMSLLLLFSNSSCIIIFFSLTVPTTSRCREWRWGLCVLTCTWGVGT